MRRRHLRQVAWHVSSSRLVTKAIDSSHGGHLASRRVVTLMSSMMLGASGGFFRTPATPNPPQAPLLPPGPPLSPPLPHRTGTWLASASAHSSVPARSGDARGGLEGEVGRHGCHRVYSNATTDTVTICSHCYVAASAQHHHLPQRHYHFVTHTSC
ncbi:hypothetical protein E2C01_099246 [Portunus trituberculatus]|uniref:Uncharacterized protein n=1 Tax=Portunus trituberculatus TaxID=210409 RepID=A0A5B7KAB9_PORTR|nr:hypothetical protein [Portunus trituberculatus]